MDAAALKPAALKALTLVPFADQTAYEQLNYIRALSLVFLRCGEVTDTDRATFVAELDAAFPSDDSRINRELCQMLVYLKSPTVVGKTIGLLKQESQRAGIDMSEAGQAMAEMRGEIDRLMLVNRDLEHQVDKEKIARLARIAQMQSTYNELVNMMESEIKRGEITISELEGRLTVNMVDRILFASGSAEIKEEGLAVLQRVADAVSDIKDKDIQVEGHTDNVNISKRLQETFASNWELSATRAATVVRFLRGTGIPGERLSAVGFGPFRPVADNKTAEGRSQNRRIQIVLVPQKRAIVKEMN